MRLRNSLAFSLGSTGQLADAEEYLRPITAETTDRIQTLIAEANRGLIALRRGEFEKGEQLYRKAIDGFRLANIPQLRISATAYLAREAALANHPKAASLIADAKISIVKATHHSAPRIIVQAEEHLKAQASRDVAGGRS